MFDCPRSRVAALGSWSRLRSRSGDGPRSRCRTGGDWRRRLLRACRSTGTAFSRCLNHHDGAASEMAQVARHGNPRFARNVLRGGSGHVLAQALPLLAAPLLTRLYSPADFGALALFAAGLSMSLALATGRFEWSVPNARSARPAAALIALGALALAACTVLDSVFASCWPLGAATPGGPSRLGLWKAQRRAGRRWVGPRRCCHWPCWAAARSSCLPPACAGCRVVGGGPGQGHAECRQRAAFAGRSALVGGWPGRLGPTGWRAGWLGRAGHVVARCGRAAASHWLR